VEQPAKLADIQRTLEAVLVKRSEAVTPESDQERVAAE
jgi:hypothetical protein